MDPKKIEAIIEWKDLKSITGLRLFLGFCNYYKRFIANWLYKTEPFMRIIKKKQIMELEQLNEKLF